MSRIFVSHSSRDNPKAAALRGWLVTHGWDDLFLDFDPERGLAAGERWQEALKEASDRCEAVRFPGEAMGPNGPPARAQLRRAYHNNALQKSLSAVKKKAHRAPVVHAAFSPDGARLVTASRDGTARLWDVPRHYQKIAAETTIAGQVQMACAMARETGVTRFSDREMREPILQGRRPNPCDRPGLLSPAWWRNLFFLSRQSVQESASAK